MACTFYTIVGTILIIVAYYLLTHQPVDCQLSSWSSCSRTCGPGTQIRVIEIQAINGGQLCTGLQTKSCNLGNFQPTCEFSTWSDCSVTCGQGIQTRFIEARAKNGSLACETENKICNLRPCTYDMKYVLVTGVNWPENSSGSTNQMEVLNDDGSTHRICKLRANYPLNVSQAAGVFTDDKIVVCGGWVSRGPRMSEVMSDCHTYKDEQGWTKLADMATPREDSGFISIPGGILVTGGDSNGPGILKSSEIVYLNGTVRQARPLPQPRFKHCIVEHKGQIIITGGRDGEPHFEYTSTVWLFNNVNEFRMTNGPNMKYYRGDHGCGIVYSEQHEWRPLLVVAGSGDGDGNNTSEFWDFSMPGSQWKECSKELPNQLEYGPKMTPTANGKGLLMTYEDGVYSFQCRSTNDCYWTKEAYELKISRISHIFLTVPASMVENC